MFDDDYKFLKTRFAEVAPRLTEEEIDLLVEVVTEEMCGTCYGEGPCYCDPAYDI